MTRTTRIWLLLAITVALMLVTALLPRVPQDPGYHQFADARVLWGIPRAVDVLSNLPFAVVGLAGLAFVLRGQRSAAAFGEARERLPYAVFFAGVFLTSLGSAYYHLAPDNARLVWDRLPMTVGFTALMAAIISDRVSVKAGQRLLWPMLLAGGASVLYWGWSEAHGIGDLRAYGFVQFYSPILIVLLIALFPGKYTRTMYLLPALGVFGVAKVFEALDKTIFNLGHVVSGHTLKHLAAAVSTWCIYSMVRHRTRTGGIRGRALSAAGDD